jgi:SprT protein
MKVSRELQNRVTTLVNKLMTQFLGDSVPKVSIGYRVDMKRAAGIAYRSHNRIELNIQLLLANTELFFERTIPHEVCHIVQWILYPKAKQAHGPEWRKLMSGIGAVASTYHSYDISVSMDSSYKLYRYVCSAGCIDKGITHSMTKIMHGKISKGQNRACTKCGVRITYFPTGENNV